MTSTKRLTADFLMSHAGLYDLGSTKELILRQEGLAEIDDACAQELSALELLSLSHNALTSLQGFAHLVNLVELNINFNQVTSLESLQCFGLQKLYAANNCIASLAPLRAFPKLSHISIFGNAILDLDAALHTCKHLLKLKSIDLDGNPCARLPGYKYHVLRALPRLRALDGDVVQALDRDLCDVPPPVPSSSLRARPSTPFQAEHVEELRGHVQLFRDDFLNNNPILLEYLAQSRLSPNEPADEEAPTNIEIENNKSVFVERMRLANPDPSGVEGGHSEPPLTTPRPSTPSVALSFHAVVDPSDPSTTIRKLLKHIEGLSEMVSHYKSLVGDAAIKTLRQENAQLQTEVNNIPILQQEIHELKKQLFVRPAADPAVEARCTQLQMENACLTRQVAKLQAILDAKATSPDVVSKEEILHEAASVDLELTELILKNEISLQLMRHSIQKTKLELQNERVAERVGVRRPMTSAGPGDRVSCAERAPSLERPTRVAPRAIHTSAGPRVAIKLHKASMKKSGTTKKKSTRPRTIKEDEVVEGNNAPEAAADVLVLA
ncbi:hypothetical protein SDRG_07536 [Saprolegnia diclina VS20]|uniref:U2A'/phosphoprotein 32 family A C-terminal domain-containing protein n=1 Tax=Saprolegnia diclina (strain VS20) TaxID=1156394 RepID=T0RWJ6_SAPDV|nr:hypothetical protein SDRG_07536 [Saprolegnia diclina VS20]EQC34722.1 hypothetical protein SDRG_07536 [Saprolegnia diclina VS20]|eukprot:XP_008611594.1 hypothetical protein SDRG_07536 [Saprolegnia diclina VS20]